MPLPANFGGSPKEDMNSHFRKMLKEFKKAISSSKDRDQLEQELDRFVNECQQMHWNHKNSEIYHKNEAEKAVQKVLTEFRRYEKGLGSKEANPQPLLNALNDVEQLIMAAKVT